ncbi:MAG: hypothetical protein IJJ26_10930 [Victivallales bacterium]|nr:hypothetical protein [Victivallales bacterium]
MIAISFQPIGEQKEHSDSVYVANIREALEQAGAQVVSDGERVDALVLLPTGGEIPQETLQRAASGGSPVLLLLTTPDFLMIPDGSRLGRNLGLSAGLQAAATLRRLGCRPRMFSGHWEKAALGRAAVEAAAAARVSQEWRALQEQGAVTLDTPWNGALRSFAKPVLDAELHSVDWQSGRFLLKLNGKDSSSFPEHISLSALIPGEGKTILLTASGDLSEVPEELPVPGAALFRPTCAPSEFLTACAECMCSPRFAITPEIPEPFWDDLAFFLPAERRILGRDPDEANA